MGNPEKLATLGIQDEGTKKKQKKPHNTLYTSSIVVGVYRFLNN
jgi:hypothetical protein